jgi:hypothetical protein
MIKSQRATLKTPNSLTSRSPSEWGSIYPSNGSNNLTTVTSPATWLMMACEALHTLYPFTHPHYPQMIHQLDLFHSGSAESSPGHMPSSCKWLNAHINWMIGASPLTPSITTNMTKNIRKSMQKSTGSSWMPLLLSKIMPCASSGSKHPGVLKVSLTSRGWVPSLPVPSGVHAPLMKRRITSDQVQSLITISNNSEGKVMKWLLGLVMEDD